MDIPSNQTNYAQQQSETLSIASKKLYFKQSTTEALHSAILLKARNPISSSQTVSNSSLQPIKTISTTSTTDASPNKILLLNPKLTNQNNLISISSTSSLSQIPSAVINLIDESSSSSYQSSESLLQSNTNTNNNYSDELDSPLKIKENILTSIRNLKPVLAGLSSSTSDDDEDTNIISDLSNNTEQQHTSNEIIIIGSQQTLPNVNLNTPVNNSNGIVKLTIPSTNVVTAPPINTNSVQRHNYLRANTCYAKLNTTSTPKLPSALNETKLNTPTTNTNQMTTVTPPIIFNKPTTSSLLLTKTQLNKLSVSSKRGKEEALSNSSSSDEETDLHQQIQQTPILQQRNNGNQKLQLILNNTNTLKSLITNNTNTNPTTTNKQNLLTVNSQSTWTSTTNKIEQPHITPVVSAAAAAAAAAASVSNTNIITNSVSSSYANSDSDLINSPSSMSSNKSDSDYGSMIGNNLSFSISSPTSCCSSSNSSSCTTNDSSSAIDLNDDNSSTASGPIYVRQPGFEFHAHEVQLQQPIVQSPQPTQPVEQKSTKNLTRTKKSNDSTTKQSTTKTNTKAKKKLCMMMNTELSPITKCDLDSTRQTSIQLKPLSNKAKREPLPMRLRALPLSFWQQPNQPNPSLNSTMYLPPLFKNEIIDSVIDDIDSNLNAALDETNSSSTKSMFDTTTSNHREVRISPANTDLLFKLFDNIEQKQDNNKKLQLQMQFKSNRLQMKQAPALKVGLSKALIKGEDPCIVDAVTEGLFPLLRLDSRNETVQYLPFQTTKTDCLLTTYNSNGLSNSSPVLCSNTSINTSNLNSNTNLLPSIQIEQNYSQALSEVVAAL